MTSRVTPLVAVLALLLVATPAAADRSAARDLVNEATGMLRNPNPTPEQLENAEAKVREAITLHAEPKGGNLLRSEYLPYFVLGKILHLQGECRDALGAFDTSLDYGEVDDEARDELIRLKTQCETRVAAVDEARQQADGVLDRGDTLRTRIANLARQKVLRPVWSTGSPSFASRQQRAGTALDAARAEVDKAYQSLDTAALDGATARARDAVGQLEAVERDAKARLATLDKVRSDALGALEDVEDRAEKTLRWAARLRPYPPEVGAAVDAVETVRRRIDTRRDAAEPDELRQLGDDLSAARRTLAGRVARPPEALTEAADAYLTNDHAAVIAGLTTALGRAPASPESGQPAPATLDSPKERFHALLLLAASRHALWSLGGGQDDLQLSRAEEAVREAATLDVPVSSRVGERFFPPAFRALVDRVTAEVRQLTATEP